MKDNPDFNIRFIRLVEGHPCLYDRYQSDYSNRAKVDEAWESISREVKGTVIECRERWKNLRGCYTRGLKKKSTSELRGKFKRSYYLSAYMKFLEPFTIPRTKIGKRSALSSIITTAKETEQSKQTRILNENYYFESSDVVLVDDEDVEEFPVTFEEEFPLTVEEEFPATIEEEFPVTVEEEFPVTVEEEFSATVEEEFPATVQEDFPVTIKEEFQEDVEVMFPVVVKEEVHEDIENPISCDVEINEPKTKLRKKPSKKKWQLVQFDNINKETFDFISKKKKVMSDEDSDFCFLKSLLPDFKKMDDDQKRRFKILMISTAGSILNEHKVLSNQI
ncbi:BESS motif,MADF domain [Cinara cedri]|uniref:BESS motif,MADF domain n=1 Tax=Cinara cedri TaxID=506608 RepID=A0A5E4MGA5_9HEMI|nr:BESS motif,MADF domain [Cinara cedri]